MERTHTPVRVGALVRVVAFVFFGFFFTAEGQKGEREQDRVRTHFGVRDSRPDSKNASFFFPMVDCIATRGQGSRGKSKPTKANADDFTVRVANFCPQADTTLYAEIHAVLAHLRIRKPTRVSIPLDKPDEKHPSKSARLATRAFLEFDTRERATRASHLLNSHRMTDGAILVAKLLGRALAPTEVAAPPTPAAPPSSCFPELPEPAPAPAPIVAPRPPARAPPPTPVVAESIADESETASTLSSAVTVPAFCAYCRCTGHVARGSRRVACCPVLIAKEAHEAEELAEARRLRALDRKLEKMARQHEAEMSGWMLVGKAATCTECVDVVDVADGAEDAAEPALPRADDDTPAVAELIASRKEKRMARRKEKSRAKRAAGRETEQ